MNITQLLLILTGVAVAVGGVYMLVTWANASRKRVPGSPGQPMRPYLPLGVIAVGLFIAYHTFSDFATFDASDVTILFAFCIALALLMALRFFLVDKIDIAKNEPRSIQSDTRPNPPGNQPPTSDS